MPLGAIGFAFGVKRSLTPGTTGEGCFTFNSRFNPSMIWLAGVLIRSIGAGSEDGFRMLFAISTFICDKCDNLAWIFMVLRGKTFVKRYFWVRFVARRMPNEAFSLARCLQAFFDLLNLHGTRVLKCYNSRKYQFQGFVTAWNYLPLYTNYKYFVISSSK